jgi:hypothetical protein
MYDNEVIITGVKLPIEELHLTYLMHKLRNEYGFLESSRNNVPVSGYKEIMPLYTYPCYEYLRSMNWENSNVFEFGCGYSTVWWANMHTNIYGVEHDQEWVNKVNPNNNYKISVEKELKPYTKSIHKHNIGFDVIVIDGSFRTECVEPSLNCLADGGIIILDNCDNNPRAKELLDKSDLLPVHFHGFKPIHVDTETTSCYIHKKFSKKPNNIIPMGGTLRVK